jgi:hypothetical protein
MKWKLDEALQDLYEKWLMETCPEDIPNKDTLIDLICDGFRYDEFVEAVKESL